MRQISKRLASVLTGSVVSECFSQSKDELIIRFEIGPEPFVIRASLLPTFSLLSFPENFQRARRNSVDLFDEIIGRKVVGVRQFENERSFAIRLSGSFDVLFKMHGNRTNVVLFRDGAVENLFRKNITADKQLSLEALDRRIDWSFEGFKHHAGDLKRMYFTFGKLVWRNLEEKQFSIQGIQTQWESIQELLSLLNNPRYYITLVDDKPALSLLETGAVKQIFDDPVDAANEFYHTFTHGYALSKEKMQLTSLLRAKLEAGQAYCEKNLARLEEIRTDDHYKVWADLIMANLHAITPGSEKIVLENFYDDQRPIVIKIKKDLSPQKNAEVFYKKAKNQHIEIERLESSTRQKQAELKELTLKLAQIESVTDLKSLRVSKTQFEQTSDPKKETGDGVPFHEFYFKDFKIWVGKNAQNNDTLTLKYSHKDDLWLHAKDVSGSHVLIKHQAGKNFPKDVIEYAASLAAYNSKRRNESLCPVIVTPKKFVRKRKGDPAGAVVVEREDVVMVRPLDPGR